MKAAASDLRTLDTVTDYTRLCELPPPAHPLLTLIDLEQTRTNASPGTFTPVVQQLQFFQETRQRTALVVNEYGELEGLVTPEDIIEELIGEFTTSMPRSERAGGWDENGECIVSASMPLRELNRWLHLKLPTDGPKTLNGLVLEILEEIPEDDVCLKIGDVMLEVMRSDDQAVRTVKLFKPRGSRTARATRR